MKFAGSVLVFSAICILLWPSFTAIAQGRDTKVEGNRPPVTGNQSGKNVPPGKEHAGAEELYGVCLKDLNECNEKRFALGQQVKQLEAENTKLKKSSSLPTCSAGHVWKHPTISDVDCYPYACASGPFSCIKHCKNQLECAPGRSCTANGVCAAPIK